jgi:hypothetical protein
MWKCTKCSEQIEDNFDSCWNCGITKEGQKLQHLNDETKYHRDVSS